MLHLLRRHLIPVRARFERVLVLTYAAPAESLASLLPPGLWLDEWEGHGFLAVAFVQTRCLRPSLLPAFLGQSFFLSGYRIFARYRLANGRVLRGLRILRSDTDRRLMVFFGNLMTHYKYRHAEVETMADTQSFALRVSTPDRRGDVELSADLGESEGYLPAGSPFANERQARRFAGPMPFTFDYEHETHSIVRIEGVRKAWKPRLVPVEVGKVGFFDQQAFAGTEPRLASCFYIEGVDYLWRRGVREPLGPTVRGEV